MERPKLVHRVEYLVANCAGKRVLHLGCTNYPYAAKAVEDRTLLHFRLAEVAGSIVGLDADLEGLRELRELNFTDLHACDLERLEDLELEGQFDVIVAGEVIEHLSNPGRFLEGVKRFMAPETQLIITTINAYCGLRFFQYALRGRGGVAEPVHPDHVAYYSFRTLGLILERMGFSILHFAFYDLGPEHRRYLPFYHNLVNDVAVGVSRQLADGIIAKCVLNRTDGDGQR